MPKKTYHYGNRRDFIKSSSLVFGALAAAPYFARGQNANSKIRVACIAVGGKGESDSTHAFQAGGDIVAICDVDAGTLNKRDQTFRDMAAKGNRTYDAKKYTDWRKMYEEMGDKFDAVTISTPDHHHGVAGIQALRMGKHVYCQKPLTQTVQEAREMRRLANEKKLATQMGNQGSAGDGLRRAVECLHAGIIGGAKELHVWSNRPIWPQGLARPQGEDPVPEGLNWDAWLGPAEKRPYKKGVYHAFNWRGWLDYGTGALGDMACHTVNMPFRGLKLGYPTGVELELASRIYPETFPLTSRIRFDFPEREGLPACKFWWYDGNPKDKNLTPLRPSADLVKDIVTQRGELPGSGCLIIGEKGKLFAGDDYGSSFQVMLNDEKEMIDARKHPAAMAIPQSIPRVSDTVGDRAKESTDLAMKLEWFKAMEGKPEVAYSRFDVAAYLTETILLGCVALRRGVGYKLDWDGPNMKATNDKEAEKFVKRKYRSGWGYDMA